VGDGSTLQRVELGSALVQLVVNSAELSGSIWMRRSVEMQDHYHYQLAAWSPAIHKSTINGAFPMIPFYMT
jgi:hypothetical protein